MSRPAAYEVAAAAARKALARPHEAKDGSPVVWCFSHRTCCRPAPVGGQMEASVQHIAAASPSTEAVAVSLPPAVQIPIATTPPIALCQTIPGTLPTSPRGRASPIFVCTIFWLSASDKLRENTRRFLTSADLPIFVCSIFPSARSVKIISTQHTLFANFVPE